MKKIKDLVNTIKEQGYKKICFWIPAYNVGGGTFYLCEIAKYLASETDLEIYYMDYLEGYPSSLLKDTNVTMLEYKEEDLDFCLQEPCVIVTNSTRVIQMQRMNPQNKFLFWHYETVPCAWDIVLIREETKRFLELANKENTMVFHGWSSRDILNRQYNIGYEKQSYFYMFLSAKEKIQNNQGLISPDEINVVWVGRAGNEKIYSIYNIIDNLAKYQTEKKKKFHIVGDGWRMNDLKKYAEKFKNKITFDFPGTIPKDKLDDYILKHADVTFAMGLSSLESAALKVPSVVVQLDIKPIKDDAFYWLFDTKEYCVGILPSQKNDFDVNYVTFAEIMDSIYRYGKKNELAQKSYNFYLQNMSNFEDIIERALIYISESTLTADKLLKCIGYMPYMQIKVKQKKLFNLVLSEEIQCGDVSDKVFFRKFVKKK